MRARTGAVTLLLVGLIGLAGCAGSPGGTPIEPPEPTATKTQEDPMDGELTWQEAKAKAQAKELEIAALIPKDTVVSIDQKTKGVLLSCNKLLVQIDPPAPGENYLVGGGVKPNEIWIDSGSPCFTLPEGIYPGGDF